MNITLRRFNTDDLPSLQQWSEQISAERYMSRTGPHAWHYGSPLSSPLFVWYVINANGLDVGVVWLERARVEDTMVVLGILLGSEKAVGRGIGSAAILAAISEAGKVFPFDLVRLNVRIANKRAISCYHKCGFSIIGRGRKRLSGGDVIEYYNMELKLAG